MYVTRERLVLEKTREDNIGITETTWDLLGDISVLTSTYLNVRTHTHTHTYTHVAGPCRFR